MKNLIHRASAAFLVLLMFAGSFINAFANTEASADFSSSTCRMIQNGDTYRFSGPCGDLSGGFDEPENVVKSNRNYSNSGEEAYIGIAADELPSSVDLSESEYFPPVADQSWLGSCASFSTVYYQFSYEMNKIRGIAATKENAASPMFVFNFLNAGGDIGTRFDENYKFLMEHGAPPQSMVPYDTENWLSWNASQGIWSEAAKSRLKSYTRYEDIGDKDHLITSNDDPDLTHYKSALAAGKVLGFSTTITYWTSTLLKEHPDAPENSKFAGQHSVMYNAGATGDHRMAIVGYNDNIWTDINGNDKVDKGEMGAFKIVNSWGEVYCNDGFVWVAYDALNYPKGTVEGAYSGYRNSVIHSVTSCDARDYESGSDIYVEFTLNTAKRTQA